MLVTPDILDRLHRLLIDINHEEDANANIIQFIQTFLARYISRSRPLSGYFLVCCVIETQWTALAQALAPAQSDTMACNKTIVEAAAANKAWLFLMRKAVNIDLDMVDESTKETLGMTLRYAMECFSDLLIQIGEMDSEPSIDTYAWETMSESLVCSFLFFSWSGTIHADFIGRNWLRCVVLRCMSSIRVSTPAWRSYSVINHPSQTTWCKKLR